MYNKQYADTAISCVCDECYRKTDDNEDHEVNADPVQIMDDYGLHDYDPDVYDLTDDTPYYQDQHTVEMVL